MGAIRTMEESVHWNLTLGENLLLKQGSELTSVPHMAFRSAALTTHWLSISDCMQCLAMQSAGNQFMYEGWVCHQQTVPMSWLPCCLGGFVWHWHDMRRRQGIFLCCARLCRLVNCILHTPQINTSVAGDTDVAAMTQDTGKKSCRQCGYEYEQTSDLFLLVYS